MAARPAFIVEKNLTQGNDGRNQRSTDQTHYTETLPHTRTCALQVAQGVWAYWYTACPALGARNELLFFVSTFEVCSE